MKQKPEESIRIYAAGSILKQLEILSVEIIQVKLNRDIEAVHRMRVSSRRMRANLDVFKNCLPVKRGAIWFSETKNLTRALGAARDTDVQIESVEKIYKELTDPLLRPGIKRLILRLKQKRDQLQEKLLCRLEEFEKSGIAGEINAAFAGLAARGLDVYIFTPDLYRLSFDSIQMAFLNFVSFEERVRYPENIDDLHAMRIAGKNLRYVMECFAPIYSNQLKKQLAVMKEAQEILGNIHDCDVWSIQLPVFLEKEHGKIMEYFGRDRIIGRLTPGIEFIKETKSRDREVLYQKFISRWDEWKQAKTWDELLSVLQVPFFNEQDITPRSLIDQLRSGGNQ